MVSTKRLWTLFFKARVFFYSTGLSLLIKFGSRFQCADKRFFFGIVSGMVVTDILLCLIPYSWVLQEWFVRAWQAVSDWHVVTVVITTIGIWFRFLLGRFWQRAAPDQSPLLSKAGV